MYTHKINKLPKQTLEIILTIPPQDIVKERESAFSTLQNELTVEGFRKGKAPKAIAEKHISQDALYQELLKTMLSRIYDELVKKENIHPIASPKVDLTKVKDGEAWEIKLTVPLKPIVELGNYKEAIKKIKEDKKKDKIWVPGKEEPKKDEDKDKQALLNDVLTAILKEIKFEMSDMVIDEELNQKLSQIVDDVRKIGLTIEAYLKSKNMNIEELKKRYRQEIEDTYKLEFALMEVGDKENIKVEKSDIDALLGKITNPEERKTAEQNSYYYASILRKQKTLDFLLGL